MYCKKRLKKPLKAPCCDGFRLKTKVKSELVFNKNRRVWRSQELCETFHNLPRRQSNCATRRRKTASELLKQPVEEITSAVRLMPLDQRPETDLEIVHTLSL